MTEDARTGIETQEPRIDDTLDTWDHTGLHAGAVDALTDPLVVTQDAPVLVPDTEPVTTANRAPEEPELDLDL